MVVAGDPKSDIGVCCERAGVVEDEENNRRGRNVRIDVRPRGLPDQVVQSLCCIAIPCPVWVDDNTTHDAPLRSVVHVVLGPGRPEKLREVRSSAQ